MAGEGIVPLYESVNLDSVKMRISPPTSVIPLLGSERMGNIMRMKAFRDHILAGFAGLATFAPSSVRRSYPHRSDAEALAKDWQAVGKDLRAAMGYVREQQSNASIRH